MNKCKRCDSTSLTYVTDYEHMNELEDWVYDNGWLCNCCDCLHLEDSFEYYVETKIYK